MTTTMTMMNMLAQAPDYNPHLFAHVEVDGFTFQESTIDLDFDNDDDAAKDIDEFTSLLASVDDEETARDIDDFSELMNVLAKNQAKDGDLNDVSLDELLVDPSFSEKVDVDALLGAKTDCEVEDSSECESEDDDEEKQIVQPFKPHVPLTFQAPIDPRSCIQTPVFRKLDSRIPFAYIPKMDVSFGFPARSVASLTMPFRVESPIARVAPPSPAPSVASSSDDQDSHVAYVHDSSKCWVCKSDKSDERKRVLHRYVEKRYCRNWKRGARYTARSRVASSRVREGGRFVTKCEWVAVGC